MLARYFEEEGLPTTGISLVRLHTEAVRPPRALWVPFELGRPLGVPGDPAFQRRVLGAALALFEAGRGPVLEDYPEDAPVVAEEAQEALACTVSFPPAEAPDAGTAVALRHEVDLLRQWHQLSVERRGRTTVGASGLDIATVAEFIGAVADGEAMGSPRPDLELGEALKLACEDLRAFYTEAATIQPGQQHLTSRALNEWFWNETAAGKAFWALRDVCRASDDRMMRAMGLYILVPRSELKDAGDNPEFHADGTGE